MRELFYKNKIVITRLHIDDYRDKKTKNEHVNYEIYSGDLQKVC